MPKPAVFIPALLCDEALYAEVIAGLGEQLSVQVMMSPKPDMAESVADILARAPATFVLAGASYGASLALEIALAAPERVTALWLTGCNPGAPKHLMTMGLAEMIEADLGTAIAMFSGMIIHDESSPAQAKFKAMAERVGGEAGGAEARAFANREERWDRLGTLHMPALVTWGREDAVVPVATGRRLAEALPHAHFYAIPGCGHLPMLEKPEEVTLIARDFFGEDHHHHDQDEHGQHEHGHDGHDHGGHHHDHDHDNHGHHH